MIYSFCIQATTDRPASAGDEFCSKYRNQGSTGYALAVADLLFTPEFSEWFVLIAPHTICQLSAFSYLSFDIG